MGAEAGWRAEVGAVTALTHLEPTRSSDQTKSSCPRVRGRARSRVTWGSEAQGWRSGAPGACGGVGWRGAAACLARRLLGARAHVHQQQRGQSERRAQRQAAAAGEGARFHGRRVLGTESDARDPGTSGGAPAPPRPLPADLGRAHEPELRCRGEDRHAQAPPLAVGVAEPVVHVKLDEDDLCGARCWGRASPPPGPARPRAGVSSPRPLLTGARGHPLQAENQGDRAVGVGAGVIASVDQHRGAPGVGRASGAVNAGQDAHRVVAVQHRAAPRHLGPELLAVCRHAGAVNTGVLAALPSRAGLPTVCPPREVPGHATTSLAP